MSAINELYQEIILDHNKSPRNFRVMDDPDRKIEGYNPLCGDHYMFYIKLEDDKIKDISFQGSGCAISKASASMMSQIVIGKTVTEAKDLFDKFHKLVTGIKQATSEQEKLGRLEVFAGVSEFPARVKCATLAWHSLKAGLESDEKVVTTE